MRQKLTIVICLLAAVWRAGADSTVDPLHSDAYGGNVGWCNLQADGTNGAVIGQYYCTGYVWSANCGWISLGHGPTNGWQYSNANGTDWGVNHDGTGRLSGYAYGANIGWVAFEQTFGQPRVDLLTGGFSGYAYGANLGWISLSNAQAYARTVRLDAGPDADHDGIPDAYEYCRAGGTNVLSGNGADADHDGVSDLAEYLADTDPLQPNETLRILSIGTTSLTDTVSWTVRPTRLYQLETIASLTSPTSSWNDAVGNLLLCPSGGSAMTQTVSSTTTTMRCYRVRSVLPLSP